MQFSVRSEILLEYLASLAFIGLFGSKNVTSRMIPLSMTHHFHSIILGFIHFFITTRVLSYGHNNDRLCILLGLFVAGLVCIHTRESKKISDLVI